MSEPVREAYSVVNGWTRGMSSIYLLISRHKKKLGKHNSVNQLQWTLEGPNVCPYFS